MSNRIHNLLIARTHAEIAGDGLPDLGLIGFRIALEQRAGTDDHARRAIATLNSELSPEGLLHRVQIFACQSLDGGDLSPISTNRQQHTRLDRSSSEKNRAGPAVPGVATHVCPCQPRPLSDITDQQKPGLHLMFKVSIVDPHLDCGHDSPKDWVYNSG